MLISVPSKLPLTYEIHGHSFVFCFSALLVNALINIYQSKGPIGAVAVVFGCSISDISFPN